MIVLFDVIVLLAVVHVELKMPAPKSAILHLRSLKPIDVKAAAVTGLRVTEGQGKREERTPTQRSIASICRSGGVCLAHGVKVHIMAEASPGYVPLFLTHVTDHQKLGSGHQPCDMFLPALSWTQKTHRHWTVRLAGNKS
ncbi:hypothetical protein C0Q70_13505 [Pomacea canaliculata]|uniref:Secreted protein n=1 Tax=Pomacea canaliculata TaxID=400727 RepID=A0A2T7NXF1_POMCA|nr:hypothetical protein C0Q70_13505 [Pomacea canaliculata]